MGEQGRSLPRWAAASAGGWRLRACLGSAAQRRRLLCCFQERPGTLGLLVVVQRRNLAQRLACASVRALSALTDPSEC